MYVCVCVFQGAYSLCFAITPAVFLLRPRVFWKQSLSSRLHSSGFFWAISCCEELLVVEEAATHGVLLFVWLLCSVLIAL